jgi:hypothetical protein
MLLCSDNEGGTDGWLGLLAATAHGATPVMVTGGGLDLLNWFHVFTDDDDDDDDNDLLSAFVSASAMVLGRGRGNAPMVLDGGSIDEDGFPDPDDCTGTNARLLPLLDSASAPPLLLHCWDFPDR